MKKVFLDPGHGGVDPGAVGNNLREKDINLQVTLRTGKILQDNNVEVFYSRVDDRTITLTDRSAMANKLGVDAVVSIHANSFSDEQAQGVETYYYGLSKLGVSLAKCIQDSIISNKLHTKDRGIKTANFSVLKNTNAVAALVELGFISNREDAAILKNKQDELAQATAKGILDFLGIKYNGGKDMKGTNILGSPTAKVQQMQDWAISKKAHPKFVELALLYYGLSVASGVDPVVTYTQSAKETGYFNFGGVLDITYNNPCGMKNSGGGGDYDPSAHKRFDSWELGIAAQVDHLALYAGAAGYPRTVTTDPRHFPYLKGTAKTVEALSGKWAPSSDYGPSIVRMMKDVAATPIRHVPEDPIDPTDDLDTIIMSLHGTDMSIEGFREGNTHYVPIRILEIMGYKVGWKDGKITVNYRKD